MDYSKESNQRISGSERNELREMGAIHSFDYEMRRGGAATTGNQWRKEWLKGIHFKLIDGGL